LLLGGEPLTRESILQA